MNWLQYMANPKSFAIKKYMADLLGQRYPAHDSIVERLCDALATEADMVAFNKLVADIYESAYLKAVNDHREQLAKLGYKVNVVPQQGR